MTGDVWDTDLGQWRLDWWAYLRGDVVPVADAPLDPCGVLDPDGVPCRREIGHANAHDSGNYIFRLDAGEMWGPQGGAIPIPPPNSPEKPDGSTEDADAAFLREIELAREVCEDQVKGDAATAFVPDVPLPFGGDVKSD
jgi:hypothetical protein